MLSTREHVDLMAMFEREEKGARLTKEPKTLWRIGVIYQDGEVNARFLAYRRGYAFGKTVDSARSPDREAGSGTDAKDAERWRFVRPLHVDLAIDRELRASSHPVPSEGGGDA